MPRLSPHGEESCSIDVNGGRDCRPSPRHSTNGFQQPPVGRAFSTGRLIRFVRRVKAVAIVRKAHAMATYAVSFNIAYDSAASYSERYGSFMEEIRKCSTVWAETTSFCLCETNETLADFETRLFLSKFSPSRDKMLVMDVRYDSAIARGKIEFPATLRSLLPLVEVKQDW
jgi:hypothetical protein